jgi:predicted nucleotidyltransferase
MLDPKSERTVEGVCEQLRARFAPRLVTVALYGSAVGSDFVPGKSDINLVVVLDRVEYSDLHALRPLLPRWRKRGLATPLVLDREFLQRALDVFPMELHAIKAHHRILFGENVFAAIEVRNTHLRYQCEHEVRGKLLRLRALYVEIGNRSDALQRLMLDSLKTFLIIMRTLNWMRGAAATSLEATLTTFCEQFESTFPVMTRLLHLRQGKDEWDDDVENMFRGYLEEIEKLVLMIDRLPETVAVGGTTP